MGKNYDNDEMEIDLLELFYVLKSKILAILGVGLLFGCIVCVCRILSEAAVHIFVHDACTDQGDDA